MTTLKALLIDDRGAALVEYALVIALLAVASITAVTLLGSALKTVFSSMSTKLAAA